MIRILGINDGPDDIIIISWQHKRLTHTQVIEAIGYDVAQLIEGLIIGYFHQGNAANFLRSVDPEPNVLHSRVLHLPVAPHPETRGRAVMCLVIPWF